MSGPSCIGIARPKHWGDEITHEVFSALTPNFIAPLSYEDIRAQTRPLDDLTDSIDTVAQRLQLYLLLPTTGVAQRLPHMVRVSANCVAAAVRFIPGGKHHNAFERHVVEIHRLET